MTRKKLLFFQVSLYWSVCSTSISLGNSFVTYLFTLFLPCTVLIKLHPHFILILGEMCLTFFSSFEDSDTYSFHQWWIKWSIWWCRKVIRPLHGLRVKTLYEANLSLLEKKWVESLKDAVWLWWRYASLSSALFFCVDVSN